MFYDVTPEELERIKAFAEDPDKNSLEPEIALRYLNLSFALTKALVNECNKLKGENARLSRRLDRKTAAVAEAQAAVFTETGLDSVEVAAALVHCLRNEKAYRLTKTKVNLILYEMYCSWLASKKERLFTEHPVATQWGPQFWRVYKRLDLKSQYPYELFSAVASQNSGVASFIRNAARKYADYSENELRELFTSSEPYKLSLPGKNGGKWNKEINDSDIVLWKKRS